MSKVCYLESKFSYISTDNDTDCHLDQNQIQL